MPTMENLMNNKAVMLGLAVVAFLIAAVLVIMIFRMLFGGRLRMPGGRARQARLGIVDAFDLDRQRQLIIVRRDNTEHLIMIGGPNDLVIESEIVRAEARDLRDQRRDPALSTGDSRIPAPAPAFDKVDHAAALPSFEKPPRPEEPMVPTPLPPLPAQVEPRVDVAPEAPRGPTFPLPPRRPQPIPDRRPAAPPKLPESVSRGDDVPAFSGQPPAPAPAPPAPMPPPASPPAQQSSPVVSQPAAVPPATLPPSRPAFPEAAAASTAASAPPEDHAPAANDDARRADSAATPRRATSRPADKRDPQADPATSNAVRAAARAGAGAQGCAGIARGRDGEAPGARVLTPATAGYPG